MLTLWFVTDWINEGFHSFLLLIDAVVYWFISVCYNLFVFLATEPIFKEEFFTDFARRIYAILGVFMLFYLAYALLNALVDPDKLSKGDKSVSKLAMNLVISLILLGLSPTIFNYAYRLQNYILSSNLIGAIVMGSELEETDSITSFGDELSFTVMNTFINPENADAYMGDNEYWSDYEESVKGKAHDYMGLPGLSKCVTKGCVIKSDDGSEGSNKKVITYYPFVSTGAGIFLIYIILSFTLDLGVRVFKFAFCQLLAPIPIVMRAMPGKKAQFDKWLKLTITVYLEVFVRVGCMYLAVYFIQALRKNITFAELFEGSKIMGMIALVILIMGVFAFAKQAPKMLSEMLGFDSGSLKLGITDKLKAGGPVGVALNKGVGGISGSLGGMATGLLNRDVNTFAAMRQGFAGGFKTGGSQFSAQRDKTFKSYFGYNAEQGIFGGRSFGQRLNDAYGKSVEKSAIEDANRYINRYEHKDNKRSKFYSTLHDELANGNQLNDIATTIMNSQKFSRIFDAAQTKADNEAVRLNIKKSDPEYKRIYNKYLDDLINRSTDDTVVRGLKTHKQAESMANKWDTFMTDYFAKYNANAAVLMSASDADLRGLYHTGQISEEQLNDTLQFKQEWEQLTNDFAKNLADGTYSRKDNGSHDKIYDDGYRNARSQLNEVGAGTGTSGGGVNRTKSDTEKIIEAIKNSRV